MSIVRAVFSMLPLVQPNPNSLCSLFDDAGFSLIVQTFSNWAWNPNDENEEDEEEDFNPRNNGRDGNIYLIDVAKSLVGVPGALMSVTECIEAGLLNGIISRERDLVSTCLCCRTVEIFGFYWHMFRFSLDSETRFSSCGFHLVGLIFG